MDDSFWLTRFSCVRETESVEPEDSVRCVAEERVVVTPSGPLLSSPNHDVRKSSNHSPMLPYDRSPRGGAACAAGVAKLVESGSPRPALTLLLAVLTLALSRSALALTPPALTLALPRPALTPLRSELTLALPRPALTLLRPALTLALPRSTLALACPALTLAPPRPALTLTPPALTLA